MSFCSVDEINRSLFAFNILETYQWMLKWTTRLEHLLRTLQQYLSFNTTLKRFECDHNLVTFPVAHPPLKYNWSCHRNHINLFFIHILNLVVEQLKDSIQKLI